MSKLSKEVFPNGMEVFQSNDSYKFTKDAIDLAKFCNIKHTDHVLELCAGSGVISFYCYSLSTFKKLYLNDIQNNNCEIIKDNIKHNHMDDIAKCIPGDLKLLNMSNFDKKLDVIICNPPYFKYDNQPINEDYEVAISRHEITIKLNEIIEKASQLIKDKGHLYLVMSAERLAETINYLGCFNFECKRIKLLTNGKNVAYLFLVDAVFNGKVGVKILIE